MGMILNEKLSPSMPSWLRDIFTTGPKKGKILALELMLTRLNVDIENAKFVEYPVPTSPRDKIKTDPDKIVFYHLRDKDSYNSPVVYDTVLVYGIGSQNFYDAVENKWYNFGEMSWTAIFKATLDMCYIDKNDPANFSDAPAKKRGSRNSDRYLSRLKAAQGYADAPDFRRYDSNNGYSYDLNYRDIDKYKNIRFSDKGMKAEIQQDLQQKQNSKRPETVEFDKSGYLKNPDLLKSLLDKHPEIRGKVIFSNFNKLYSEIVDVKDEYAEILATNRDFDNFINKFKSGIRDLNSIYSDYNNSFNQVSEILKSGETPNEKNCNNKINYIRDQLSVFKKKYLDLEKSSIVDWDDQYLDDDEIDDED